MDRAAYRNIGFHSVGIQFHHATGTTHTGLTRGNRDIPTGIQIHRARSVLVHLVYFYTIGLVDIDIPRCAIVYIQYGYCRVNCSRTAYTRDCIDHKGAGCRLDIYTTRITPIDNATGGAVQGYRAPRRIAGHQPAKCDVVSGIQIDRPAAGVNHAAIQECQRTRVRAAVIGRTIRICLYSHISACRGQHAIDTDDHVISRQNADISAGGFYPAVYHNIAIGTVGFQFDQATGHTQPNIVEVRSVFDRDTAIGYYHYNRPDTCSDKIALLRVRLLGCRIVRSDAIHGHTDGTYSNIAITKQTDATAARKTCNRFDRYLQRITQLTDPCPGNHPQRVGPHIL